MNGEDHPHTGMLGRMAIEQHDLTDHDMDLSLAGCGEPSAAEGELIGDPTLADAILDRSVHNAYRFNLTGDSMQKKRAILTPTDDMQ